MGCSRSFRFVFFVLFYGARMFNQPVNFQTGNVENMNSMFESANAFNQLVDFNSSSLLVVENMFASARSFNSSIIFTPSTAQLLVTRGMFTNAVSFDQPLVLQTDNVQDMTYMFNGAQSFNQSVNFNTSNVEDMSFMFAGALTFNKPIDFDVPRLREASFILRILYQAVKPFDEALLEAPLLLSSEPNEVRQISLLSPPQATALLPSTRQCMRRFMVRKASGQALRRSPPNPMQAGSPRCLPFQHDGFDTILRPKTRCVLPTGVPQSWPR